MSQAFRFLHASDLHLEQPPGGLAEVPDALRALLVDAPYRAAERVFDAAIKHEVDFVLLAGDVVDPHLAGPRALVFLDEQFQRLIDHGIRVYWAGGPGDRFEHFADAWPLPAGVHRFPLDRVERVVHHRDDEPLAQIFGTSSEHRRRIFGGDFALDAGGLFAVAVAHGTVDAPSLATQPINYWALGGSHWRHSLDADPLVAHYCGSSQGRGPGETGPRGCTLVHVDETLRVRTAFVPTDTVRYLDEQVVLDEATTYDQLFETLSHRSGELLVDPFGPQLLIRWTTSGSRSLADQLRSGKMSADLVELLRDEHGAKRPAAWTVSVESSADDDVPEELYEEETLLGEFLRTLRHYEQHADEPLNLADFLAQRHVEGRLGALAALDEEPVRRHVLAEAAALGVALLGPREAES